ncbi:MAG: winged helix-turn-helix domain-containing protein [Haliangiales bacterium]
MKTISLAQARRVALCAQGFCDPRPAGRVDARHFRRVLARMTILQLDSVNVVCRSHFLPVFARLGPYDRDRLDAWLWRSGENHEFLAHEASITAMELYPLLRHRMTVERWRSGRRFRAEHPDYLDAIRAEIDAHGPLSVRDLSDPGGRTGPWWGWSKGKLGLEVMYRSGDLAIAERTKTFLTRYDLPERVVPAPLRDDPAVDANDAKRAMLLLAAQSHGLGTDRDLADYFRLKVTECRPLLEQLVAEGQLDVVEVEGWDEIAYVAPDAKRPGAVNARALLSPFDPVVWCRPRAERLFGFHYRIEIYVPAPKRIHGYYVLPFLLGDQLVGRVDLKADRKSGFLQAKGAFLEPGHAPDVVAPALAQTLAELADWLGLDGVSVGRRGDLAGALAAACR